MKKITETEISFAEMIEAITNTHTEVESPLNILDANTLFSLERFKATIKLVGAIVTLKKDANFNILEQKNNGYGIVSNLVAEKLWFSSSLATRSAEEMKKFFFGETLPQIWEKIRDSRLKTRSCGYAQTMPELLFTIGRNDLEIGVRRDSGEGYDIYIAQDASIKKDGSPVYIKPTEAHDLIETVEKVFSPKSLSCRNSDENRASKEKALERIRIQMDFRLEKYPETPLAAIIIKEGSTYLSFP